MVNLELEMDEGIILQSTEVERYGFKELSLDEMVLTNKNIVCVYEKSTGLFSKAETIVEKIPLSTIKVANNQAQVMIYDSDDYGEGLQVLFVSGHREHFVFSEKPRKTMPLWINEINRILVGIPANTEAANDTVEQGNTGAKEKKGLFGGLAGALNFDLQSTLSKAQEKIGQFANQMQPGDSQTFDLPQEEAECSVSETSKQVQHQVQTLFPSTAQVDPRTSENKSVFCSNCGTKLNEGAKFCHGCGSAVGTVQKDETSGKQQVPPTPTQPATDYVREGFSKERQQEYVGRVLKCSNCGAVISERTAICPECGMQITGKVALSSVQAFKEQLMELESHRKKTFGGMFGVYATADPVDKQKLTLIKNFPIPSSIDDCLEFMMFAIANIDVKLSKNTWMNSGQNMEILAINMPKAISDAWVAKMEQIYKKAEIIFPNDPVFVGMQKMYFDKMKELKIKVK